MGTDKVVGVIGPKGPSVLAQIEARRKAGPREVDKEGADPLVDIPVDTPKRGMQSPIVDRIADAARMTPEQAQRLPTIYK